MARRLPPPEVVRLPREKESEAGFDRKVLLGLSVVAGLSLAAAIVLSVIGESETQGPSSFANSYSYGALGHRALADLLRAEGVGVVSRRSPGIGGIGARRPLILAEPSGSPDPVQQDRLAGLLREAAAAQAPVVLVLPKWLGEGIEGEKNRDWIGSATLVGLDRIEGILSAAAGGEAGALARVRHGAPAEAERCAGLRLDLSAPQLLELSGAPWEVLVSCRGGALAAHLPATAGRPELVIVADPDLLNNQGLGRGDNAELIGALFLRRLGATGAVFDETIHGFHGAPGLLAEAARFPVVLAVLHGVLLLALILWAGMGRFGKPIVPLAGAEGGREVLIESTAQLLSTGANASDTLERYLRQTLRAIASDQGLPAGLSERELRYRLQSSTAQAGVRFELGACESAVRELRGTGSRVRRRAVEQACRLHEWRRKMGRTEMGGGR